jgi:LmbE family N-acetylglucosaminyl deacetylase
MTNSYPHIYLSPHYDDASLSCGGAIHRQTQAGEPALVVTVCAAPPPPDEPLSPLAERLHRSWGSPSDVIATRQAEDRRSMETLGADYVRLNFQDCIYRGHPAQGQWFYNNGVELFGPIHPEESQLVNNIVAALLEVIPAESQTTLYAPLSVGRHIDHQLVHAAARQLQQQGWLIAFYEDYPYADPASRYAGEGWGHTLETALAAPEAAHLRPQLRFFSEEDLQAKINSVRAYASQLEMLFDEAKVEEPLRTYALQVGEGRLAERVWLPG